MTSLPDKVYSAAQTRQIDFNAIEEHKIPGFTLMKRAGEAAINCVNELWPSAQTVAIFCGPGNNGGDGYVLAKLCHQQGKDVTVYSVGGESKTPDANRARKDWLALGNQAQLFDNHFITQDVIIDAMLGSGIKGEVSSDYAKIIDAINASNRPVLSMDIPSGLDANTGCILGTAVHAQATITFIGLKSGLIQNDGFATTGKLFFDNLGVPQDVYQDVETTMTRLEYHKLIPQFPLRKPNCHKGSSGHVVVIGGGHIGFSGAVCLASEAALRAGCGLVSCVVPHSSLPLMSRLPQEVMCYPVNHINEVKDLIRRAQVIVFGPGLGQTPWSLKAFDAFRAMPHIKVIDADGLNLLAQRPVKLPGCILTPHPREAARLLGITTEEVQADRIAAIKQLEQKFDATIVLKGAGTLVQAKDLTILAEAVPALATAGTGDVLSGVIGGLLAQGVDAKLAAQIGVTVHAGAGKIEQSMGACGMLASDLFLHIRSLLNPTQVEPMLNDELFT